METNLKTGDICFYKGRQWISLGIRLLTSVRYGIPLNETISHVDIIYDGTTRFSAEPEGAKYKDISNKYSSNDIVVYRFTHWSENDACLLRECVPSYENIKYAFARYGLDAARIFSFVLAFLGLVTAPFNFFGMHFFWLFLGIALIFQLTAKTLLKYDKITMDCAELTADILSKLKKMISFSSKNRNEFPNNLLGKMQLLSMYKEAVMVGSRKAGNTSDWEWAI